MTFQADVSTTEKAQKQTTGGACMEKSRDETRHSKSHRHYCCGCVCFPRFGWKTCPGIRPGGACYPITWGDTRQSRPTLASEIRTYLGPVTYDMFTPFKRGTSTFVYEEKQKRYEVIHATTKNEAVRPKTY